MGIETRGRRPRQHTGSDRKDRARRALERSAERGLPDILKASDDDAANELSGVMVPKQEDVHPREDSGQLEEVRGRLGRVRRLRGRKTEGGGDDNQVAA